MFQFARSFIWWQAVSETRYRSANFAQLCWAIFASDWSCWQELVGICVVDKESNMVLLCTASNLPTKFTKPSSAVHAIRGERGKGSVLLEYEPAPGRIWSHKGESHGNLIPLTLFNGFYTVRDCVSYCWSRLNVLLSLLGDEMGQIYHLDEGHVSSVTAFIGDLARALSQYSGTLFHPLGDEHGQADTSASFFLHPLTISSLYWVACSRCLQTCFIWCWYWMTRVSIPFRDQSFATYNQLSLNSGNRTLWRSDACIVVIAILKRGRILGLVDDRRVSQPQTSEISIL